MTGDNHKIVNREDPNEINSLFTIEEEIASSHQRVVSGRSNEPRYPTLQNEKQKNDFHQTTQNSIETVSSLLNLENYSIRKNNSNTEPHFDNKFNQNSKIDNSIKYFFLEPSDTNKSPEQNKIKDYIKTDFKSSVMGTSSSNNHKEYSNTANHHKHNFTRSETYKNDKSSLSEGSNKDFDLSNKNETSEFKKINPKEKKHEKIKKEIVIPYRSIDCIFNKKNIWINLQTQEPDKICYDIWDENSEHIKKSLPSNPGELHSRETIEKIFQNYLINIEDIPAFYTFKDLINPLSEDKITKMKSIIIESLEQNIRSLRSNMSLKTNFRKVICKLFIQFFFDKL